MLPTGELQQSVCPSGSLKLVTVVVNEHRKMHMMVDLARAKLSLHRIHPIVSSYERSFFSLSKLTSLLYTCTEASPIPPAVVKTRGVNWPWSTLRTHYSYWHLFSFSWRRYADLKGWFDGAPGLKTLTSKKTFKSSLPKTIFGNIKTSIRIRISSLVVKSLPRKWLKMRFY